MASSGGIIWRLVNVIPRGNSGAKEYHHDHAYHLELILKSIISGQGADGRIEERRVEELEPRGHGAVASWAAAVLRLLPYLIVLVIISAPLVFTTARDSFFYYYDKVLSAFGEGRVVDGIAGLLQILLLVIPVVGITLTLVLIGKRLGTAAWRWSEGRPALRIGLVTTRFGLAVAAVAAVGVALFTLLPNSDKPTTDGQRLKDALKWAGVQVATLLSEDEVPGRIMRAGLAEVGADVSKLEELVGTPADPVVESGEEGDSVPTVFGQTGDQAGYVADPYPVAPVPIAPADDVEAVPVDEEPVPYPSEPVTEPIPEDTYPEDTYTPPADEVPTETPPTETPPWETPPTEPPPPGETPPANEVPTELPSDVPPSTIPLTCTTTPTGGFNSSPVLGNYLNMRCST